MSSSGKTRAFCTAAVAALTLVAVQAALAESPRTSFNASDQAAARAAVLRPADLGSGWTGGLKKGTVDSPTPCAGWNPRQADLVITGVAESEFSAEGVILHSSAQVYKTSRMIALDWRRTVVDVPLRCLSKQFADAAGKQLRVVSIKRISFPRLATYTARVRIVADYTAASTVRVLIDAVLVGRGRTALSLGLIAPYTDRVAADAAEARLARILLARTKA